MPPIKITHPATKVTRKLFADADTDWSVIEQQIRTIFGFSPSSEVRITYTDQDGDVISISTTPEFKAMIASATQPNAPLRFVAEEVQSQTMHESTSKVSPNSDSATQLPVDSDWVMEEKTTIEDISSTEHPHDPSINGAIDQKAVLEPAEQAAPPTPKAADKTIRPEKTSVPNDDKGKGKATGEHAGATQNVVDEIRAEINAAVQEFFSGSRQSPLARLPRLLELLERIPPAEREALIPLPLHNLIGMALDGNNGNGCGGFPFMPPFGARGGGFPVGGGFPFGAFRP